VAGRIEQRIADPHFMDVIDGEMWVLEQVGELVIDLKGVVIIE
jgi:hypothetical protein